MVIRLRNVVGKRLYDGWGIVEVNTRVFVFF